MKIPRTMLFLAVRECIRITHPFFIRRKRGRFCTIVRQYTQSFRCRILGYQDMKKGLLSEYVKLKTCFAFALQKKQGVRVSKSYSRDVMLNLKQKNVPYMYVQSDSYKDIRFGHVSDTVLVRRRKFCATAMPPSTTDCMQYNTTPHFPAYTKARADTLYDIKKRFFFIRNTEYPLFPSWQLFFSYVSNEFECKRVAEFLLKNTSRHNSRILWYNGAFCSRLHIKGFTNYAKIAPKMVKGVGTLAEKSYFSTKLVEYALQSLHVHGCSAFAFPYSRSTDCSIVRPLLDFSRTLITTICISHKIPVYPDTSNQSLLYSRNRIRKQIIPFLQLVLNPQMEEAIFRFAELAFQEQELTSKLCRQNHVCL